MPETVREFNVFVSQPMNGRDNSDIIEERWEMLQEFKAWAVDSGIMQPKDIVRDCNSNWDETSPSLGRIWYLGRSIQNMEKADFVIFHKDHRKGKGCQVEMAVASRYFKNCVHVSEKCEWTNNCVTPSISNIYFNRSY